MVSGVNGKLGGWYKTKTWDSYKILSKTGSDYLCFRYFWSGWKITSLL